MVNDILKIKDGETENEALWRIGQAKESGLLGDITWPEIAEVFNRHYRDDETCYYDSSAYRKKFRNYLDAYNQIFSKENFTEKQMGDYEAKKRELDKARIKLQTEKLEYNRWLREEARDELIGEKICDAIREYNSVISPQPIVVNKSSKSAVLAFGDEHYGVEFTIYGLHGEIINEYNPEIFEKRMWTLFLLHQHL